MHGKKFGCEVLLSSMKGTGDDRDHSTRVRAVNDQDRVQLTSSSEGAEGAEQSHPLVSGFYWVEYRGEKEVMSRGIEEPDSGGETQWYRFGESETLGESEIEFVDPGRLKEPAVRMDYSVEDEFDSEGAERLHRENRSIHQACCDCGMDYPFEGLDLFSSDEQWKIIFPDHGGRGVLCANCITKRVAALPHAVRLKAQFEIVDLISVGRPGPLPPVSMESGSNDEF